MKVKVFFLLIAISVCVVLFIAFDVREKRYENTKVMRSGRSRSKIGKEHGTEKTAKIVASVPADEMLSRIKGHRYIGVDNPQFIESGSFAENIWYDSKTKTTYGGWNRFPVGTPAVKLRFRRKDEHGQSIPCPVWNLYVGGRFDGAKIRDTRTFELDGVLCHDDYEGIPYSHAAVVPLVKQYPGKHDALVTGEIYEMEFVYLEEGERKRNSRLVKMPDDVPRGRMAVIDVDVTKKQDRWWDKPQILKIRVRREILTPDMSLHVWDAEAKRPEQIHLESDGRATVKLDRLGGDLRLARTELPPPPAMQHREIAFPLWYVRRITQRQITLPDDADLVIKKSDVIDFRLKLPGGKVPADAAAIGLLASRQSHLSLAHAGLKGGGERGRVDLNCAPGTYYVVVYGNTSSAWGKPSAMRRVSDALEPNEDMSFLGRITIKESDASKTLEVQPLGE